MSTAYAITVDTEEEWDWNAGWPRENLSLKNIARLPHFQEICARYGASVTYFTDHAVLADPASREILLRLAEQPGVEIGMHIHPWNTPPHGPDAKGSPVQARETFLRNLDDDLIISKLSTTYETFREIGLQPTSFRGGRYSSGGVIHRFLQEHGFVADASVVPFTTWRDDGAPDYRNRDLLPQRIAPLRPGEMGLWEIPLSLGFSRRPFAFWHRVYDGIERSPLRYLRLIGIAERVGIVRRAWLNFEDPLGHNMLPFLCTLRRMQLPLICFTLHSSSLLPGGNHYTTSADDEQRIYRDLESALSTLASWEEFYPGTISEVAQALEREQHASHRHQPVG
jgi:hypothetical protein